jgi:hypothetical protein
MAAREEGHGDYVGNHLKTEQLPFLNWCLWVEILVCFGLIFFKLGVHLQDLWHIF